MRMNSRMPMHSGCVYHIYNRGNNSEDIFREATNYDFLLALLAQKLLPIADLFAYCLMRNHFHLLMRVKQGSTGLVASRALGNVFNSYAHAFNKRYDRTGSLFENPFHRILVDNNQYFTRLVQYIHLNPQKHGFVKDFRDWPHSSYSAYIQQGKTKLARDEVLSWFDGRVNFANSHKNIAVDSWLQAQDFE